MKNIIRITGITLLIVALAVPALAARQGVRGDRGQRVQKNVQTPFANLTPEQQEQLSTLHKKFRDETADDRNEMAKKYIDLRAILQSDNPDAGKAKAVQKEINKLQARISEARLELIIETKKILPDAPLGRGFGMGPGMRGMRGNMPMRNMVPGGTGLDM